MMGSLVGWERDGDEGIKEQRCDSVVEVKKSR